PHDPHRRPIVIRRPDVPVRGVIRELHVTQTNRVPPPVVHDLRRRQTIRLRVRRDTRIGDIPRIIGIESRHLLRLGPKQNQFQLTTKVSGAPLDFKPVQKFIQPRRNSGEVTPTDDNVCWVRAPKFDKLGIERDLYENSIVTWNGLEPRIERVGAATPDKADRTFSYDPLNQRFLTILGHSLTPTRRESCGVRRSSQSLLSVSLFGTRQDLAPTDPTGQFSSE
ncbi:hypothetical protein, partial [Microbacterium sp. H6]|uniref:hypothetical protein n=1 Tax=Microbacterium sp. H6 TaxID=421122 RepID=UPI001C68FE94